MIMMIRKLLWRKNQNSERSEGEVKEKWKLFLFQLTPEDTKYLEDLCESIRETARLIDTPANILTTDALLDEAVRVGKALNAKVTVIRGEELLKAGFGGIYHVGKAGPTPPSFVVLSHEVADAQEIIALVGKGVVYDTGGMQIKGKTGMPSKIAQKNSQNFNFPSFRHET